MKNTITGLIAILFFCFIIPYEGQSFSTAMAVPQDTIPLKVFLIGEDQKSFEKLSLEYQDLLLTACDDDMEDAFMKWMQMLRDIEAYSEDLDYDIKGVKMWLKVFWGPEGTIRHIAYFLKPNSRNINIDQLTAFFKSFISQYKFPVVHSESYSHYGSAAFPTFPRRVLRE